MSWVWLDPFWSRQKDGIADKKSWQYGTNWQNWSADANGSSFYTRRRLWFRYAQRKEVWVNLDKNECTSIINGSNTTDTVSIREWNDTPPISPSTSSSSISESLPEKPTKENLRRLSVPVTFKIPTLSCNQKKR